MISRDLDNEIRKIERILKRKKAFVVDDLRPAGVHSTKDCHVFNQDVTRFLVLNNHSELLPCSFLDKLRDQDFKDVLHTSTHVINHVV